MTAEELIREQRGINLIRKAPGKLYEFCPPDPDELPFRKERKNKNKLSPQAILVITAIGNGATLTELEKSTGLNKSQLRNQLAKLQRREIVKTKKFKTIESHTADRCRYYKV